MADRRHGLGRVDDPERQRFEPVELRDIHADVRQLREPRMHGGVGEASDDVRAQVALPIQDVDALQAPPQSLGDRGEQVDVVEHVQLQRGRRDRCDDPGLCFVKLL